MTQPRLEGQILTRRGFLKAAGAIGIGAMLTGPAQGEEPAPAHPSSPAGDELKVPTRPFGKSGRQVSILSLGGMFDIAANQLLLRQALKWGVTYWDTADCYQTGSETGIGKYFTRYPQDREKIFLVTKSDARDPEGMSALLAHSLANLNTSYVDLYFLHGISDSDVLTGEVRRWAEKAKAAKKIKLFGFSTHTNMADCLQGAADLGWIDGIMLTYNVRNMAEPEMDRAVKACARAGIGLTAMKAQAGFSWINLTRGNSAETALIETLQKKGWTPEQAKLKAVWRNPHIASICSQMDTLKWLKANVAAASDPTDLSAQELGLLQNYCRATADQYCAGCGRLCESAVSPAMPIGDIMRCHMYNQGYGRPEWARAHFQNLPHEVLRRMAAADYDGAERSCPQHLPIGRLMRQAVEDFG